MEKERLLCPSMMCANFENLGKEIEMLEKAGVDIFHLDVMDGQFVPNFGMGLQDIEYICSKAKIEKDVHLMIENPGNYIDTFADLGVNIIYIHPESDRHPMRTLQKIIKRGIKPGIAINPGTSIETIYELLPHVDYLMVMSVNPGFAGQTYIDSVNAKIEKLNDLKAEFGFKIMLDGACSPEKIKELSPKGVDGFVLGTSALFGKEEEYETITQRLRTL
ncbi:ribulose-phosphate 3-epimerase [Streptococcus henryi]|uniref:ribulose-phosphate 3-epimerase n=1 Tax=Streptococcus henryi TaxID=439219 RepID=UPI0003667CF9|nr:ribulose-phosphate 3-epimerase [Streptococcus henryi]